MRQTSYGYTIFCDDVRLEIGGKYSLMGVYSGVMYVSGTFPVRLPKFFVSTAILIFPKDLPVKEMELLIFWPGNEDDDAPDICEVVPPDQIQLPESDLCDFSEGKCLRWQAHIGFAPLVLNTAGKIKVRAKLNGRLLKLGTLRIEERLPEQ